MRTASEMREFAARYNVANDYLSAVNLERCPFEEIVAVLRPDERVIFCFGALYEKAIAATNYRLLHAETRDPQHDQLGGLKVFSYDSITSVFSMNMLLQIKFRTSEPSLIYGNLSIEHIREAGELLGDVVKAHQTIHGKRAAE